MNLPTFKEWASLNGAGCGFNINKMSGRQSGLREYHLIEGYYTSCELLDNYSQYYRHHCTYFDINVATVRINRQYRSDEKQTRRKKNKQIEKLY